MPARPGPAACMTATPSASRQPPDRLAGADHIDAIQEFLLLDRILLAGPRQVTITNRQAEMFCHLVLVDNLAGPHADLGGRLGPTRRPRHARGQQPPARPRWRPAAPGGLDRLCSANWGL